MSTTMVRNVLDCFDSRLPESRVSNPAVLTKVKARANGQRR